MKRTTELRSENQIYL